MNDQNKEKTIQYLAIIKTLYQGTLRHWFVLLLITIIGLSFLFLFRYEGTGEDWLLVSGLPICILTSIIALTIRTIAVTRSERRRLELEKLNDILSDDKLRVELRNSAECHRRMAVFNNISSVGVLLFLLIFVAFENLPARLQLSTIQDLLKSLGPISSDAHYKFDDPDTTRRVDDYNGRVFDIIKGRYAAEDAMLTKSDTLLSEIIIRFSVVGVGIYLVVMFNRAYKYNATIASLSKYHLRRPRMGSKLLHDRVVGR